MQYKLNLLLEKFSSFLIRKYQKLCEQNDALIKNTSEKGLLIVIEMKSENTLC